MFLLINCEELWAAIEGSPKYQVSSKGRVRSLYVKGGHGSASVEPSILRLSSCRNGYSIVHLYGLDKRRTAQVHRLVAKGFLPNIDMKSFVNHKDGNKKNNRLENLEWCTRSENMKHAYDTGLVPAPPKKRKLSDSQVMSIWENRTNKTNNAELSLRYNVDVSVISRIKTGKSYEWLTQQHA